MSDARRAAQAFTRLVDIMATLRGPDGCPWDREQTIDSLKKYVLEETYEVLDAIDRHDHHSLREELGDFLLQAVFLAQLESEAGHFSIADCARAIADKLVRRHPHVFGRAGGEPPLDTADQVRTRWEEIKAEERGGDRKVETLLSGIPKALPSLLRAHHIAARAASVGFDWHQAADVIAKLREEVEEIREVVEQESSAGGERLEEEVGDLLFAMANLSRKLGVEPETALRKANDKFTRRFTVMETLIGESGRKMPKMSLDDLEAEWQRVKVLGS
jgi:MazG family protein